MLGKPKKPRQRGVTLIELMVVVIVVATLAAVAVPAYRNYVTRTQRTDATTALLRLAAQQEKFYLQFGRYANEAERVAPLPAGLGMPTTAEGWYTLQVTAADAITFSAQAVPAGGSPTQGDQQCQLFTINAQGVRTSAPDAVNVCWR